MTCFARRRRSHPGTRPGAERHGWRHPFTVARRLCWRPTAYDTRAFGLRSDKSAREIRREVDINLTSGGI